MRDAAVSGSPPLNAGRSPTPGSTRPLPAASTPPRRWWLFLLTGGAALLLLPLALVQIPPLLDYPNHLARMYVMARGAADPFLARMYGFHWLILPNLAIDLIMPGMVRVMPLYLAGRIVLGLALLLPVAGTILYSRALFGFWSLWSLGAGLVAYNALFLLGFMNFGIGTGLALMVAAFWVSQRERRPVMTVALTTGLALVTFFFHIFGFGLLGLLISAHEMEQVSRERTWRALGMRIGGLGCVAFLPLLLLRASPLANTTTPPVWLSLGRKLSNLTVPVLNYSQTLDRATGLLIVGFVLLCAAMRWARFAPSTVGCIGALLLLAAVMPGFLLDTGFIQDRFAVICGFLLFAVMAPVRMPRRAAALALVGFAGLLALRIGYLSDVWLGSRQDIAELREVIATVPPGSKVLFAQVAHDDNPAYTDNMRRSRTVRLYYETYWHLPALLAIEHDSFWPLMFASGNKQPLFVRPPYDRLSRRDGKPPDYQLLAQADRLTSEQEDDFPYLPHWQSNFDYVLIMPAGGLPDAAHLLPADLTLVRANDMAALYAVKRKAAARVQPAG